MYDLKKYRINSRCKQIQYNTYTKNKLINSLKLKEYR